MSGEPEALLPHAVALHQSGRLAEAAQLYRQIIEATPQDFDATHLLGVIDLQEGRLEAARDRILAALQINPANAGAVNNLGTVYLRLGHAQTALGLFERALTIEPDLLDGLINLGTALRQLSRLAEALVPLQRAFTLNPKSPVACNLLGACLLDSSDPEAAVGIFEAGIQADPRNADAWANLAVALGATHEYPRALECAQKSIEINPRLSAAFSALAASQFEQGEVDAALSSYETAVKLPDVSDKTLAAYANALLACGHHEEAMEQLRRAIEMEGNNAVARWKLSMANCKAIYSSESEVPAARAAFSRSLDELAGWFSGNPVAHAYTAVAANQPFFLAYQAVNNRQLLSQYGRVCAQWMTSLPWSGARPVTRDISSKMRIGVASAHIRDHSVWNAITKGWMKHLDRSKFEIYLFQLSHISDDETDRARRQADYFEDRPDSLEGWIAAIQEAELDALIYPEIGMYPMTTQLASLRLAPLQIGSWGHPETTGLPTMDLYLSAEAFEPDNAQNNYSERIVPLPNLGVYTEPLKPAAVRFDLKSIGLRDGMTLLLCPGTPFKYMPVHDKVWAAIAKGLESYPVARMVFFQSPRQSMSDMLEQRLRKSFDLEGVEFDSRACIVPMLDRKRFFGLMQKSALMLDTLGFSGFNTALQGIECGLPVLAREGEFMRGRLASAIMRRLGLPELVATSDAAFVESAIQLAGDAARRKELRKQIVSRREILFHDLTPVRALEKCLTEEIARSRASARAK
jgi:protein O-GlcNAc transferase